MIKSFRDPETRKIFERRYSLRFPKEIQETANRKMIMIDSTKVLDTLKSPPGNRLEKLTGNRKDQYSIRINDKYRICFEWDDGDAYYVEIVDYH